MLINAEIDHRAIEYIQLELSHGNSYARSVLKNGFSGRVTTFLPEGSPLGQIEFAQSIELTTGINIFRASRNLIYPLISSFLSGDKRRIALIETYYYPTDISKLDNIPPIAYYQKEIYYMLGIAVGSIDVDKAFSSARDYPFVCGLVDLGKTNYVIKKNLKIPQDWWDTIAQNTQHLVIGAYDAEGFLIWSRSTDK